MDATTNGVTGGSGVDSDTAEAIVERVRERYAHAAQQAQNGGGCGCGACCGDTVSDDLYAAEQVAGSARGGGACLAWLWQPNRAD